MPSSKFKSTQFTIHSESQNLSKVKIIDLDNATAPVVKNFQMNSLKSSEGDYASVRSKFGPLAATDADRAARTQKDRRFSLNPLLREPLSVEQEERRVIEEKVRSRIDALADDARVEAAKIGHEEGFKKGFEEAFKETREEGAKSLERFDLLLTALENAKADIFRANERFLIELVFRIARMVILKDLSVDQDYLLRLTKELISRLGARDNIKLRINSDDAQAIDQLRGNLIKSFGEMTNLNIEASAQVKRGGCQIETEWNAIDASVENQLQMIYDSLIGKSSGGSS